MKGVVFSVVVLVGRVGRLEYYYLPHFACLREKYARAAAARTNYTASGSAAESLTDAYIKHGQGANEDGN